MKLADHAFQAGAERGQQVRTGRCGGRAATQTLAINRHVARRLTAAYPDAESLLQRHDIEITEQFTPHRRSRNARTFDADGRQCLGAQFAAPAHDAQLIATPGQHRRDRDQQQARQRVPLALGPSMVRHRAQRLPQGSPCFRPRCFLHDPVPSLQGDQNRSRCDSIVRSRGLRGRTESPWQPTYHPSASPPARPSPSYSSHARDSLAGVA